MTRLLLPMAVVGTTCISISGGGSPILRDSHAVSAGRAAAHVAYLASDELQGRDTPSAGLDNAAAYIARVVASAGLSPQAIVTA